MDISKDRDIEEIDLLYREYCESIRFKNRFFSDKKFHEFFDKIIENNKETIEKGEILYRARIHERGRGEKPYIGKDIGKPDAKVITSIGRVSPYGINYLYVAKDIETAMAEVRPSIDDFVSVGKFRLKKNVNVVKASRCCCGGGNVWDNPTSIDTSRFFTYLSQDFRKPINNANKELEYLPMQYFTEYCKTKGIQGVKFLSSVMDTTKGGHFNITFFNDTDIEYCDTEVFQIREINYKHEKLK